MAAAKKRGLGRGLDALLGGNAVRPGAGEPVPAADEGELRELAIDALRPGRYQPRQAIAPEALEELAQSIRAQGLIQPIVARPVDGGFEIIAGERRWRAARQAGLAKVPCLVRDVDDRATVAMALIENIQREDLNPLEEANALRRLIDEFELTHQEVADAVGRSRAAVSNLLRLLELPAAIRTLVEAGSLDMGHARALLTLPEPQAVRLAEQAAAEGWSVRQLEQAARQAPAPGKTAGRPAPARPDPDISRLEQELAERLCAPVSIRHGRAGKGQVVIRYHSLDELDGVLERLRRD
ncbi:MAG: ParB/RepB/Spo0J family partition protein [Pseudoxanthomonas sp.]|nr:ParB/RepB/Spo0J family partition protein [Pseudoxanthomonas sp.]